MTHKTASQRRLLSASAAVAASAIVTAAVGLGPDVAVAKERSALPQQAAVTTAPLVDLEKAFWVCDHAGTNGSVDSDTGIVCTAVTQELTIKKFSGDYDALLAWWREHKPAQHRALSAAVRR